MKNNQKYFRKTNIHSKLIQSKLNREMITIYYKMETIAPKTT